MRKKAYYNVVTCDHCNKITEDASEWYRVLGKIDFSNYNGQVNDAFSKFDFCSKMCAGSWLDLHVARVTKVVDKDIHKPS